MLRNIHSGDICCHWHFHVTLQRENMCTLWDGCNRSACFFRCRSQRICICVAPLTTGLCLRTFGILDSSLACSDRGVPAIITCMVLRICSSDLTVVTGSHESLSKRRL